MLRKTLLISIIDYTFLVLSALLLTLGSLGIYKDYSIALSITCTLLFIGIRLIIGREIKVPGNFPVYILFLVTLIIHSLIFKGSSYYVLLFVSSGLYWLMVYNLKKLVSNLFPYYLVFLGILMVVLYAIYQTIGIHFLSPENFFLPISTYVRHNHLGDLWALILVVIIYKMTIKATLWHYLLTFIGVLSIALSHSRSAIVSLAVGGIYIYYSQVGQKKLKGVFLTTLAALAILFLFASLNKSTLFSRPYFAQAVNSLINTPQGIGIGNFYKISSLSSVAHNIVLEFVSGMGIFSVVFIFWLYRLFKNINNKGINTLYQALFLAIFTNLFFDMTYIIPTMIWGWFFVIALVFV